MAAERKGRTARLAARIGAPLVLAVVCALLFLFRSPSIRTSLYELAGDAAVPDAVRGKSERLAAALVSAPDAEEARAAAVAFAALVPDGFCESVRAQPGEGALSSFLDFVQRNRAGLVSRGDAAQLETPDGRGRIAGAAARRFYSSPIPPLFSPGEDPFCLADGFVAGLPFQTAGLRQADGFLTAEIDGSTHVLVLLTLKDDVAANGGLLAEFLAQTNEAVERLRASRPGVSVALCGVPVHTATAGVRTKREIGILSTISVAFIVALCVLVFHSAQWVVPVALTLATAAVAGGAALLLFFDRIHVMSLLLGTTALGLVVDYSFHWLLSAPERIRGTRRSMAVSFATTQIGFLPLMASSLPVLRQAAVFLSAALCGALAYVLLCERPGAGPTSAPAEGGANPAGRVRAARLAVALSLAVALVGLPRVRIGTPLTDLYRPPAALAEAERVFAEVRGASGGEQGTLVLGGDGEDAALETLLAREAEIDLPDGVPRLSRFLPPLGERVKNHELVKRLYDERGAAQGEMLGLDSMAPPPPPKPWNRDDIPAALKDAFTAGDALVVPSAPQPGSPLPKGAAYYNPQRALATLLGDWTQEAKRCFAWTLPAIFAALLLLRRRAALAEMLPPLCATSVVAGVLTLLGSSVNLFHIIAFFLLAGMGIDYAVFIRSGGAPSLKPTLCSMLTSAVGFGALAFVSFPVARALGIVMGVGLPVAFLCALALPPAAPAGPSAPRGGDGNEHFASSVGIEFLLFLYRVAGLGLLHVGATLAGYVAWLCSRGVRAASLQPGRIAAFARSLADKTVVMSGGRRLPEVVAADPDALCELASDVEAGRGAFILSSHCGTIEVLSVLGKGGTRFHAWMDFDRTSVFNSIYLRHAKNGKVVLHPISGFGPETIFEAGDAIDSGDCLIMAADRGGTGRRVLRVPFGDGEIALHEGAFRLASLLGHPVYFAACVETSPGRYLAYARRLVGSVSEMARGYAAALHAVVSAHPAQWFNWGEK